MVPKVKTIKLHLTGSLLFCPLPSVGPHFAFSALSFGYTLKCNMHVFLLPLFSYIKDKIPGAFLSKPFLYLFFF